MKGTIELYHNLRFINLEVHYKNLLLCSPRLTAPLDSIEMYEGNSWESCPSLPEALMGVSALQITPERAFIVGGMAKDTNPRDSVRQITWTFSQERPKWDNFPPMPTARYNTHLGW